MSAVGDGLDNDCGGLIDEELCTAANGGKGKKKEQQLKLTCSNIIMCHRPAHYLQWLSVMDWAIIVTG